MNLPGLMGFVEYCVTNMTLDVELYGGSRVEWRRISCWTGWIPSSAMNDAMHKSGFYAPGSFRELMEKPKGIISLGPRWAEGWLLTLMISWWRADTKISFVLSPLAACRTTL